MLPLGGHRSNIMEVYNAAAVAAMELIRRTLRCPDVSQKKKASESQWIHCFYF